MNPHYYIAFLWRSPVFQNEYFFSLSIFSSLCTFLLSSSHVVFPWWSHPTASTLTALWLTPKPLSSLSPNHISSCLLGSCKSHTGNFKSICSESNSSPPTTLSFPRFNPSPCLLHPHSESRWNLTVLPPLLLPFSLHCNCPHPNESLTAFLFLQFAHPSCTRRMVLVWLS